MPPSRAARTVPAVLLTSELAAVVVLRIGGSPLLPLAVLVGVMVPGYAVLRLLELRDPLLESLLGVALSLSAIGLIALGQVYLHIWEPTTPVLLVLALGSAAAGADLLRASVRVRRGRAHQTRRPPPPEWPPRP